MIERTARKRLAENLRVLRFLRGWSQEELAEVTALHRTYISGIERGERNVTLDNLERLAGAFGLAVPDLLRQSEPADLGQRLIEKFRDAIREEGAVYRVFVEGTGSLH